MKRFQIFITEEQYDFLQRMVNKRKSNYQNMSAIVRQALTEFKEKSYRKV